MTLVDQLKTDINRALKSGEDLKVETVRGLAAAVHNREIELRSKGKELDEEEVLAVLGREAKKRKEAEQIYAGAGRTELAKKELEELEIIKNYLPPEMGREEVEAIVRKVIGGLPAGRQGATDFGRVMGAVMQEAKGRAEASMIKEIVEKELAEKG